MEIRVFLMFWFPESALLENGDIDAPARWNNRNSN